MRILSWRVLLILTHRWMGIALGLVVLMWTISGIVLMYYGLPHLTAGERLARLPALEAERIAVAPAEAAAAIGAEPFRIRLSMQGDRPVYRLNTGNVFGQWTLVYADTGEVFEGFDADSALAWLGQSIPEAEGRIRHDAYLTGPDLFSNNPGLQTHMPMHRFSIDDAAGTKYYVSERTGEAVLKTDRIGRLLGFVGYELHTLFFWRQQSWWGSLLQWLSWTALVMALLGLVLGILRYSLEPRFVRRRVAYRSPYSGLMKWHHYAGLIFGAIVLTWIFSGLVSLSVVPGIRETLYRPEQIAAGARSVQGQGPRLPLDDITPAMVREAAAAFEGDFDSNEIELVSFGGKAYWLGYRKPTQDEVRHWRSMSAFDFIAPTLDHEHRLVDALSPGTGSIERLSEEELLRTARLAMPDANVTESVWLESFDGYYYPRQTSFDLGLPQSVRSLPVLRVSFDDPERTWLYLDPAYAQFVKFESTDRINRWTYYGLHGFDFLLSRRPLWDVLVLTLLVGGLVLSATTLWPMCQRLGRHARRIRTRVSESVGYHRQKHGGENR